MAGRRIPLGLLAPVSLLILVVALGALQYRWVGQVSEAERAQLTQSLDRRAREFAEDFDRQIGRAFDVFRLPASFTVDTPDLFAKRFDDWQATAAFAGLVKSAYFVKAGDQKLDIWRFAPQTRSLEKVEWPHTLSAVRERLLLSLPHTIETPAGKANVYAMASSPVLPEIPAILIPQMSPAMELPAPAPAAMPDNTMRRLTAGNVDLMVRTMTTAAASAPSNQVILELDREFIASTVLPVLVERHFGDTGADRFRVAVVNPESQPVLTRGVSAELSLNPASADAVVPFFGTRFETIRVAPMAGKATAAFWAAAPDRAAIERRARESAPGPGAMVVTRQGAPAERLSMVIEQQHSTAVARGTMSAAGVRVPMTGGWRILLQHAAGSLDAAVANARRRNLWLSFGILGVLATSTFLVLLNARRSEKLAAQQMDFVATVSHELRTPVAVIRSAAQNLSAGVVHNPEQAKRYGELIDKEGRRLTDMVEQVLEYAGLSGNRRPAASRPVDVASLVHDVVQTSQALQESQGITFDVRIDEGVPAVLADEDALRRALLNLVSNALKYGAAGRWVGLSVSRGTARDDGQVVVAVSDRGRGIPAADLAHIFEPFYRGRFAIDQQIHGNGLGLSLVKRIAEAHGGRISVKSTPDQGSTFTIVLPASSAAAVPVSSTADVVA